MYSEAQKKANQHYYEKNKDKISKKWKQIKVSVEVHEAISNKAKELDLSVNSFLIQLLSK